MISWETLYWRGVPFCSYCCLVTQSWVTLCDSMDRSLQVSSAREISQARLPEWVAISFSRASSRPRDQTQVSYIGGIFLLSEPPGKPHPSLHSPL